tara:strand:+ start:2675 stop:3061 length:387 start_codon:yes stop_codon:yes gene_type:complete
MLQRQEFKELFVTAVVLLIIDVTYLYLRRGDFNIYFLNVQKSPLKFRLSGAILAYFLLILGMYHFIIRDKKSLQDAFLLGVFVYGVYDFTNYATLSNWTLKFSLMDMFWGGTVLTLSTFIIYELLKYI